MVEKESHTKLWQAFARRFSLTDQQLDQFKRYYHLLIEHNQRYNLTAITSLKKVIKDHFEDSLALAAHHDLKAVASLADVGAGAGFPALPLKILFPHLRILLIEVTRKKRQFLQEVCTKLGLEDVEICELDWRTFLRTTQGEIDLFVSRAALDARELTRLFRHTCSYRNALLMYWASGDWVPEAKVAPYVLRTVAYTLGEKERRLVFMAVPDREQEAGA